MKHSILLGSIGLMLTTAATAAGLPRQGNDAYTTDYIVHSARPLKLADRTASLVEFSGVSRNDKGSGMFHRLGVRCVGLHESGSPQAVSRGACTETDADGDQMFSTYESRIADGKPIVTHVFVGGTGKYAGMTGRADYSVVPVKSSDGMAMFSVPHRASWKLP
ncbi:hypothetical protein [uncultured Piscinibacter sp.]|mgnify:CR=1 FL=1|uniref:hypothetical protein n=1 Tax=uncultured Piscinibacter sp. TaxID=1131835 RepID=UPI002611B2CA|nr:hypothetical protein [uncultured Piscinibacter sp.]